ncbi:MAG: hypothetical protein ABI556_12540 [Gemmatimonadales bacterium]
MPSRAETRGTIESVLRGVSILLLAWMFWLSLDRGQPETVVSARSANLGQALHAWSSAGTAPDRISIQLDSTPTVPHRDWIAALRAAGSIVAWSGRLPAAGVEVQPIASPKGGLTVFAAAPSGNRINLVDDVGSLDTADARGGGARFAIPSASGDIKAKVGGTIAATSETDSVQIKRVLVLGDAGWESKFVVAALEEDGWKVDAQMRVAPGISVTQGSINPIDTSRYSAVIALDESAAAHASDIVRYVMNGGGVILSGTAASIDGFSSIRAGAPGKQMAGALLASDPGATTLKAVPLVPIAAMRSDAIVLDRRDGAVAVAARRHVGGRVLQQGYVDTWRWRMGGGDASLADHRAWWTRAVAGIAYAPRVANPILPRSDAAPIAGLIGSLGEPTPHEAASLASAAGSVSLWWLFALLSLSLLGEWASRRMRGAR